MGPEFLSNRKWKPLEWISGQSETLNTDLKPMPFCPGHIREKSFVTLNRKFNLLKSIKCLRTYVPIFVFALSAATYIADGSDVLLLESRFIVKNGDAVLLYNKSQCWNDPSL